MNARSGRSRVVVDWGGWRAGRPFLIVLAILACGCESAAPLSLDAPHSPPAPAQPLVEAVAAVEFPREVDPQLRASLAALNPTQAGWASEAFQDEAARQLARLGEALRDPEKLTAEGLAAVADEEFACGALRPRFSEVAFADAETEVRRGAAARGDELQGRRGPQGLAEALRELAEWFGPAGAERTLLKIYRVELFPDGAETTVYFEASGARQGRLQQQTATWTIYWRRRPGEAPRLRSIAAAEVEEVRRRVAGPWFRDGTEGVFAGSAAWREQLAFGLDHWLARLDTRLGNDPGGWHGLAMGDADGDGLDDLYVPQPGGLPNRLFLQTPDGTLREAGAAAGVDWLEPTRAALFLDLDGDGDQDLALATYSGLVVLENEGAAQYRLRRAQPTAGRPTGLAAADIDGDGALDLYVCTYGTRQTGERNDLFGVPIPYHDANNGTPNHLFRNEGGFRLRDVTAAVGLDENNRRFSWSAAFEDFDQDGDLDLYVANDFGRNNLYRNDGGRFRDVAGTAGVEDLSAGMSVSWGDFNQDGRPDLYVSNMFSSAGNRVAYQRQFRPGADARAREQFQRHARGNSLFENAGDGTFRDVSEESATSMALWAWGSTFADLNNDGREDLVAVNGLVSGADGGDL